MHPVIRNAGKEAIARILGVLGRNGPRILVERHPLMILCYHRVVPAAAIEGSALRGLCVRVEVFSRQMDFLRKHFHCCTLSEAMSRLESSDAGSRPMAVVTFDDGYADNYQHAFPVLRKSGVPATVFLVSGLVGTDRPLWFDEFAELWERIEARNQEKPALDRLATEPRWSEVVARLAADAPRNVRIHAAINELKKRDFQAVEELLIEFRKRVGGVVTEGPLAGLRLVGWDEAAEMHASGIEFGSHTETHPILTRIPEHRLRAELHGSKAAIEHRLGTQVSAFCYPNGDYDHTVLTAVREAGYRYACTVQTGPNDRDGDRLQLNRLTVGPRTGVGFGGRLSPPVFAAELLGLISRGNRARG